MNESPDAALAPGFRLVEQSASTAAAGSDLLFLVLVVVCGLLVLLLAGLLVVFSVKYRQGSPAVRTKPPSSA